MTAEQILKTAVNALSAKKAVDISILKLEKLTIVADYFIICNGTSVTQIKTLADEVEVRLEQDGVQALHREGYGSGTWVLLDYGSVIVHIFHPESRAFYNLEKLWADAAEIGVDAFLDE